MKTSMIRFSVSFLKKPFNPFGSGIALIVYFAVGWWGFLLLGFWVGG
jgi:hypothetical protein